MSWIDPRIFEFKTDHEADDFFRRRWEMFVECYGAENLPPRITNESDDSPLQASEIDTTLPSQDPSSLTATSSCVSTSEQPPLPAPSADRQSTPPPNFDMERRQPDIEVDLQCDPRKGEAGPVGVSYAPFGAVTKFCYKYTPKAFSQPIANRFFDAGKIFARPWDLYYVWTDVCHRPIVLVTEPQLQTLLDEINLAFPGVQLSITEELRQEGVVVDFDEHPQHLRPRFLGHSISRVQHDHWFNLIVQDPPSHADVDNDRSFRAYREKIAAVAEAAQKNKSKGRTAAKRRQAVEVRQGTIHQLSRCQRLLGLLGENMANLESDLAALTISALDPDKPAPYSCEEDAIIIAVDVEAHEFSARAITEVGVAMLDTRLLKDTAPGQNGENWHQFISARHFRTIEWKHHTNSKFVNGCPDHFEFGESEFVSRDNLPAAVAASCRAPQNADEEDAGEENSKGNASEADRNIILLGHDVGSDIRYLASIGLEVLKMRGVVGTLDTVALFKAFTQDPSARSLGSVLASFDLDGWYLHNAGNDAVYTLWAMLATAVQHAHGRGTKRGSQHFEKPATAGADAEAAAGQAQETFIEDGGASSHDQKGNMWTTVVSQGHGDMTTGEISVVKAEEEGPKKYYTEAGAPLDV